MKKNFVNKIPLERVLCIKHDNTALFQNITASGYQFIVIYRMHLGILKEERIEVLKRFPLSGIQIHLAPNTNICE